MTDLTPEQIEKWAGDERGKELFEAMLAAIHNTAPTMMYGGEAYLYADATIQRLTDALNLAKSRLKNTAGHLAYANRNYATVEVDAALQEIEAALSGGEGE